MADPLEEHIPPLTLEEAMARIAELEKENEILKAEIDGLEIELIELQEENDLDEDDDDDLEDGD